MIPRTQSTENTITQTLIQNETENKEKNTTVAKIHNVLEKSTNDNIDVQVLKVDKAMDADTAVINAKEQVFNAASIIRLVNMETESDIRGAYVGVKQSAIRVKPPQFWVQFNLNAGSRIPDGSPPMDYQPDRNMFVRIVFVILLFMLIVTAGFCTFVYMTDLRYIFLRHGMIFMIVGALLDAAASVQGCFDTEMLPKGGMLGLSYAMMCSPCTRTPPCNYVCLVLAVIFMSLITAYITARYRTQIIMLAILATIVTVLVCLCLACTSFDFTKYLLYVIMISVAFGALALIISITMLVTKTRYKPLHLAILVIGTLINVVVLTIELQMILGGRTVELSEDDYAIGAFMLYTSIVDLFIKLVQILGILDSF